jgi:hypothetical protein
MFALPVWILVFTLANGEERIAEAFYESKMKCFVSAIEAQAAALSPKDVPEWKCVEAVVLLPNN